jgi:periplasmic protein TonB
MDVTDVLRDREREAAGSEHAVTVSVSVMLHGALFALLLLAPNGLLGRPAERPRSIMTISLGGGGGPQNGGRTAIGGRPVQVQTPPEEAKKPEAVRAPAAKAPEMTLPKPDAKPAKLPEPSTKPAPDQARGRTPTRGAEVREGNAVAETGARGQGFGLSTGGGPGSGSTLDVADFCCPEYVALMLERIRSSWSQRAEVAGNVIIKFTIERDGRISDTSVERSSGYDPLDINARRAVLVTQQLPPLPSAFPNPTLTVHLNFQYQR